MIKQFLLSLFMMTHVSTFASSIEKEFDLQSMPTPNYMPILQSTLKLSSSYSKQENVQKYFRKIAALPSVKQSMIERIEIQDFTPFFEKAMYVNMNMSAVCDGEEGIQEWRLLATNSLFECVGAACWNPITKRSALAHISEDTKLESLSKFLDFFKEYADQSVITLCSSFSSKLLKKVVDHLEKNDFKINYLDINPGYYWNYDVNKKALTKIVDANILTDNLKSLEKKSLKDLAKLMEEKGFSEPKRMALNTSTGKLIVVKQKGNEAVKNNALIQQMHEHDIRQDPEFIGKLYSISQQQRGIFGDIACHIVPKTSREKFLLKQREEKLKIISKFIN